MTHQGIIIEAPEEWQLHGTLFETDEVLTPHAPVVMVSGAAAVPHSYYSNFARYLVGQGVAAVLTYDYRGIAASAGDPNRWRSLKMKDWALLDFPAATAFLQNKFPDQTLVGIGHSYGGQAVGLSGVADQFARFATVATMSGYWRGLDTPWSVWMLTQIFGKAVASVLGRVPELVSPGTTMPGGIFLDWSRWIASPDYFFSDPDLPETTRYTDVTLPFLSIGLNDDPWGTRTAIHELMRRYENADLRQLWIKPGGTGKIGHLGYFSRRHSTALWPELYAFISDGRWPDQVRKTGLVN